MHGLLVLVDLAVRVLPRENERSAAHTVREGDPSVPKEGARYIDCNILCADALTLQKTTPNSKWHQARLELDSQPYIIQDYLH
jgi:hypothetical protein